MEKLNECCVRAEVLLFTVMLGKDCTHITGIQLVGYQIIQQITTVLGNDD